MHQVSVRVSSASASDRRVGFWSDNRFRHKWGKSRRTGRPRRYLLYAGLLVGFCVLLAFAGCGEIAGNGQLTATVSGVDFGAVTVGKTSTATVSFMNSGTGAVQVTGVTVAGGPFKLAGSGSFPINVAGGSSYSFQVEFTPAAAGQANGTATVASNATASAAPTVGLTGLGVSTAAAPVSASTLSGILCNHTSIVGSGTLSCSVSLSAAAPAGGVAVGLASNNAAVTVTPSVVIPSGAVGAGFTATASTVLTPQTATLTATADGVSETFALQLSPAAALLSASPTAVTFGDVSVNTTGTQTVTLIAAGSEAVTINTLAVTGTDFTMAQTSVPVTLNPGQSVTLTLQFSPTVEGAATGQLTVSSTATSGATMAIALSGSGAVPYQVNLTWEAPASSSDPVAGYNVYRALSGSSSYQLLNAKVNLTTTYSDSMVKNGQSYVYYVTSVDALGAESAPSNSFDVTIP